MEIIYIIPLLVYLIILIYKTKGIPNSISETYYRLEHKYWFGFVIIFTAISLMILLLNVIPASIQFLAFLSGAGMMFVGVSPNFKEEFEGKIHEVGAFICLFCSLILILFINPCILITWIIYVLLMILIRLLTKNKDLKYLFWMEIIALFNTYCLLFL